MGFKPFNKTTIQLPLPSSTLTKAEYKEAYGIDLDHIDFPKVTLLVDDNEKYPVDEIKIVSDDILIFAGGKVLTIGDNGNVSVASGAYSVENAKPIYCHPILIANVTTPIKIYVSLLIFNNSADSINTFAKFLAEARSWGVANARIPCTGSFDGGKIATQIDVTSNSVSIYGTDITDGSLAQLTLQDSDVTQVVDGANKIN